MGKLFAVVVLTPALALGLLLGCADSHRAPSSSQNDQPPQAETAQSTPESTDRSTDPFTEANDVRPAGPQSPQAGVLESKLLPADSARPSIADVVKDKLAESNTPRDQAPAGPTQGLTEESKIQTYLVLMLGHVRSQDVRALTEKIRVTNHNPGYTANAWLSERPVLGSANALDVQNLLLADLTEKEMADFKARAEVIPGLNIIYRPVQSVQGTITLVVRNLDDEVIASFEVGQAKTSADKIPADLNAAASYLLANNCRMVDSTCLKSLKARGFLDASQAIELGAAPQGKKKTAAKALASLVRSSLAKLSDEQAAKSSEQGGAVRQYLRSKLSSSDRAQVIKSIDIKISDLKMVQAKDPQGSLPIDRRSLSFLTSPAYQGPFVEDAVIQYLFTLPINEPPVITNGLSDEQITPEVLKEFYHTVLQATE